MAFIRVIVMVLLGGMSSIAHACSCAAGGGPACQEAWSKYTQAVFLGRVLDIHTSLFHWTEKVVELEVEEAYLGVSVGRVTVLTPVNGPACGYHFVKGERYVVYAGKASGQFHVSMCSHTRLAKYSQEEIAYLRSIPSLPTTASIIGSLWKYTHDPNFKPKFEPSLMDHYRPPEQDYRAMVPVPGIPIVIRAQDGTEQSTMVASDGNWQLSGLPPGDYSVTARVDEQTFVYPFRRNVTIRARGCAWVDIRVELNGRIAGRLLHSPRDESWVWIKLFALPVQNPDLRHPALEINLGPDQSDFELAPLPPGEYILGAYLSKRVEVDAHAHTYRDTAPTFYRGVADVKSATPISVGPGEKRTGFSFRMLDRDLMPVGWAATN